MKKMRPIVLPAKKVEKMIGDLSLIIVSMDRIGSRYYNRPRKQALEFDKYLSKVDGFKLLAEARKVLSVAYNDQSSKSDTLRLEESCDDLPYWK